MYHHVDRNRNCIGGCELRLNKSLVCNNLRLFVVSRPSGGNAALPVRRFVGPTTPFVVIHSIVGDGKSQCAPAFDTHFLISRSIHEMPAEM